MGDELRIDFRLSAEVNGQTFRMEGEGIGDIAAGSCSLYLEADPAFPEGFDPVSCPMICSHPTSLFFSRPESGAEPFSALTSSSYAVSPERDGRIFEGSGREVLHLRVKGTVRREGDVVVSEHEMAGYSNLPPLARNIAPLDDYLLPFGPSGATGLARWQLLAKDGMLLDGVSTVPYRWTNGRALETPLARRVERLDVEWDGGKSVAAHYTTSLRPLEAAAISTELVGSRR